MGLRDALRSLRGGDESAPADGSPEIPEIIDFRPRTDGRYKAEVDPASADPPLILRFSGSLVSESTTAGEAGGEYTPSGRFSVHPRFERPIIYTILRADEQGFTTRRTDAGTGQVAELRYRFVEDSS